MLHLEIITPKKIAFSGTAESIVAPGAAGVIGILPRHTNLFAQLVDGEVKVITPKQELYLAIGGGFVEVHDNQVSLLVTRAVHADELNEQEILKARQSAREALSTGGTEAERAQAQQLFRRSLIDLRIARRTKRRRMH